jgi:diguanylate cyclase (GGDEF)-like protein
LLAFGLLLICCGEILSSQTVKPARLLNPVVNGRADSSTPLTTVAQIRALPAGEAAKGLPVELHATLTYYEPVEGQIFVQDETGGIYVVPPAARPKLAPGEAVVVRGTTVPSFETNVKASEMNFDGESRFPKPVPVNWREILQKVNDCRYVSLTGTVRSATLQLPNAENALDSLHRREGMATAGSQQNSPAGDESQPYILMDLETDGGAVRVHMEDVRGIDPLNLLDSQVRIDGVAGGIFDGKYQQTGAELWVSSSKHMEVLKPASGDPAKLPLTKISRIISGYYVKDQSRRVHLRGSVTLYEPGLEVVLETPDQGAVLVNTYEQSPLHMGQVVDAVGFPDSHQYSEVLTQANILPTAETREINPVPIRWGDALGGRYPYDLVSMEGTLAAEVHERHEDMLVIQSGAHVFSAILSRTVWNQNFDQLSLPEYRVGSQIRVSGVCFVHAGGPWGTERWFELQMRTPQDISVLVAPPWWTVRRLLYLSAGLLALMMGAFFWAVFLQRKVRKQTEHIRLTMESEAARERRIAFLEKERGRVLEAINSMLNLDEVLRMILRLISGQLEDRSCWCELTNGTIVGDAGLAEDAVRRGIYSGAGERLGTLVVCGAAVYQEQTGEALEMGASLAALAIDNRRLYETLMHRSQYDQLTNAANRFLLESRLDEALAHAERSQTHFALIYIDLDQFKQVNDLYGHRVGDLYLQQVAERFSESLRGMDTLARVGGDEFIALIPVVRNRAEVEEISRRLTQCFNSPFHIDGYSIGGTASIGIAVYPEDGLTKDDLKRVADSAMYGHKPGIAVL